MSDGITFEQWKYIFQTIINEENIQLSVQSEADFREFYDDDLSPEDAINVIKALEK